MSVGLVQGQPTFDECKIFLVASDTARDLILNKDEYIRFLNLIARTYLLQDDFTTYDELPTLLQTTYKAYAWTTLHEVDISAAAFGAGPNVATQDATDILKNFCDETSQVIASLLPTDPPTLAPTVVATYVPDETTNPSSPTALLQDDITKTTTSTTAAGAGGEANLLPGPSDALSELPVECRRGMFGSDQDMDGLLNQEEYTTFVGRLMPSLYSSMGSTYNLIPQELKDNYDRLVEESSGMIDIYGALPAHWAEATSQQRSFLQLICYRTEDAIQAVAKRVQAEAAASAAPVEGITTDTVSSDHIPIIDIQLGHGPDHHQTTTTTIVTTSNPTTTTGTTVPPTTSLGGASAGGGGLGGLGGALSSIKTKAPITLPPLPSNTGSSNNQTTSSDSSSGSDGSSSISVDATNDDPDSPSTSSSANSDNNGMGGMATGNIIAIVFGSILIIILVVYLARNDTNKQSLVPIKYIRSWINEKRNGSNISEKRSSSSKRGSKGRRRRRSTVAPDEGGGKDHSHSYSERTGTKTETESRFYDLESSSEEEDSIFGDLEGEDTKTGFLEDDRMMMENSTTSLLRAPSQKQIGGVQMEDFEDEEKDDENPSGAAAAALPKRKSSAYGFQTVRFNPDEFINAPQYACSGGSVRFNPDDFIEPQDDIEAQGGNGSNQMSNTRTGPKNIAPKLSPDEERLINANFQHYQYDNPSCNDDDDDNSSAMSLYCNSVADEKPQQLQLDEGEDSGSVVSSNNNLKGQGRNFSTSTAETDLLTEFSSPPRRSSKTMYHANRFEQIAQSESRSVKSDSVGSLASRSIPSSRGGSKGSSVRGGGSRKKLRPKMNPSPNKKLPTTANKLPPAGKTPRTTKPPPPPPPPMSMEEVDVSTEPKTPRAGNRRKIKKKPNGRRPGPRRNKLTGQKSTTTLTQPNHPTMPIIPTEPEAAQEPESPVDQFLRQAMDMSDNHSASGSYSTGVFFEVEEEEEEDNELDQRTHSASVGSPQSLLSFSYGGREYNIEDGQVTPSPQASPTRKRYPAKTRHMHFTEITTGKQEGEDSDSESTSFLSDDFTDPGDEMLSYKKQQIPPPPRPNTNQTAEQSATGLAQTDKGNQMSQNIQKPQEQVRRTKAMDQGDEKPVMNDSQPGRSLSFVESIISEGSCDSFLRDSNSTSCKDLVRGDSDSTFDETESKTSTSEDTSAAPESSSTTISIQTPEGDPIQEIHRLVAIVMPSEQGKVTSMLEQYQGREVELAKTLRRLEVRMKARRLSGRPIHVTPPVPAAATKDNVRSARIRTIRKQAQQRKRSSVARENAAMIAAAASTSSAADANHIFSGGPMMDSESSTRSQSMFDLELSSSEEGVDDEFSQDSTYCEEQGSSNTSFRDDESLSIFSDLR